MFAVHVPLTLRYWIPKCQTVEISWICLPYVHYDVKIGRQMAAKLEQNKQTGMNQRSESNFISHDTRFIKYNETKYLKFFKFLFRFFKNYE